MSATTKAIAISFLSGVLMGLAPAPINAWYLAWMAIAPLWFLLRQEKTLQIKLILALAWGFGYYGLALWWITGVHPLTWMGVPWLPSLGIAFACWLFITTWGTVIAVSWALLFSLVTSKIPQQRIYQGFAYVLFGATLWCGLETLWSYTPLWWPTLAYTQSPANLTILQLGQLSGVNTINALILAVNGLLAEGLLAWQQQHNPQQKLLLLAAPLLFFLGQITGYYLEQVPIAQDNLAPIKVGIIQGNIPNEIKLFSLGWQKAIAGYTSGYRRLAKQGVDVVLTPETALPFYWQDIIDGSSFYQAVITEQVTAWVGANGRVGNSYTNSLFTLTGEGQTYSRYDKYKLVPLGEYIPFESILGNFIDRLSPLEAHLAPGKWNQVFETPFGRAIVAICYESAFPQHFQRQAQAGGEFIITAANNAHYSAAMPAQHHAHDVMRAIESDRWLARATNTGYSAIIDPRGKTRWISELNQYAIEADTIYRRQTQTLYLRWGDWLLPTLLLFSLISRFTLVKAKRL